MSLVIDCLDGVVRVSMLTWRVFAIHLCNEREFDNDALTRPVMENVNNLYHNSLII